MIGSPAELAALDEAGRAAFPGFQVTVMAATASTQDVVREAARGGAAVGFSCLADAQTAGRGRHDRRWSAPPGTALLGSLLVRPTVPVLGWVPLAAGLAMRSAIARLTGCEAGLKWPNDLIAGGAKLAGVLCEVEPAAPGAGPAVVVGVGVNLRVSTFPSGVAGASLHQLCADPPLPATLFGCFVGELRPRLDRLDTAGPAELREEWLRHAVGLGEVVTATSAAGRLTGVAEGIDLDGALVLRTANGVARVLAGDVHLGAG